MTPEQLAAIAAALLSLTAAHFPGFSSWYQALDGVQKRLLMLGLLAASALASYGLACAGWGEALGVSLACDQTGALGLVRAFLAALVANQATYAIAARR
jgi:hypothetical protein